MEAMAMGNFLTKIQEDSSIMLAVLATIWNSEDKGKGEVATRRFIPPLIPRDSYQL